MNFNSLINKKVFCRTVANEQLFMVLANVTPDYLIFRSITTGEYSVPKRNVIEIGRKGVPLVKANIGRSRHGKIIWINKFN